MAATADAPDDTTAVDDSSVFYDTWLDYLVVALLALEGLVAAWLGVTVAGVDRAFAEEVAAEFFADPDAAEFPLTEPELADAVYTVVTWAGWGLVLAGIATVAAGVLFYRYRGRVRDRVAAGEQAPRWHAPLLGGLLGTALFFVPFPQVLGGGVAGYVSDGSATLDGALAGLVFGATASLVWAAVFVGVLVAGFPSVLVALLFLVLIQVVVDAVLGAIGGLVGGLLA